MFRCKGSWASVASAAPPASVSINSVRSRCARTEAPQFAPMLSANDVGYAFVAHAGKCSERSRTLRANELGDERVQLKSARLACATADGGLLAHLGIWDR